MGQEVTSSHFQKRDFDAFTEHLRTETELLRTWFEQERFDSGHRVGGFEVEAWLIDPAFAPAPVNSSYLERLNDPMVVPELSQFNVEINTAPQAMQGGALQVMYRDLSKVWQRCCRVAQELGIDLAMIGILPTVREPQLTLENISRLIRYRALNEQILRLRQGSPLRLDIHGFEHLETSHHDVMLEAAATSFQLHLQIPQAESVRVFNAATILSAPMVALAANSPYLFGKDLWDETRIPLFEQAIAVDAPGSDTPNRVFFGNAYVDTSLFQLFADNRELFPVLLPMSQEQADPERMEHLRLHNGTIWRWNRPLIGFSANGTPHLRLEHRVMAAGPSVIDTIANAAMFYGLVHAMVATPEAPELRLSFEQARLNFYAAAKHGLRAKIRWLGGEEVLLHTLLVEQLIPMARQGLLEQDLDKTDVEQFIDIIEGRVRTWCNGAAWQRMFVEKHRADMQMLTEAYVQQQNSGKPVHEWEG